MTTSSIVLNPFVLLFLRLMEATIFNGYRKDLPRKEREINAGEYGSRMREQILRDFRMMCSLATVEEIAEVDRDLGIAAKMVSDGYDAWLENWYWYGATEEERADSKYPVTEESWMRAVYEKISESDTYHAWHDAVDNFNRKRPLFGQERRRGT
jgi:hypothetical protein